MSTSFPTPSEFNHLSDREKKAAYARIYRHWQAKGADKRRWRNDRRRGAEEANRRYAQVIEHVIRTFWTAKHERLHVTANSLYDSQVARFTSTAMAHGTVVNWNTSLRYAWRNRTWDYNGISFKRFSELAREHRSRH